MALGLHNANATAGAASVGARTLLHTGTSGACLLVWIHSNEATTFSAVAAGTNPLTLLGAVSAGGSRLELWGLTSAPTGILTISAIQAGTNPATWCMAATTYVGQRTTASPFGTVVGGTATGTVSDFSVSSTADDTVAFAFGISAATTITLGENGARLLTNTTHSTTGRMIVGEIKGAATVSLSASSGASGVWGFLGVPVITSAIPANTVLFDNVAHTATTGAANSRGLLITATAGAVLLVFTNVTNSGFSISAINVGSDQLTRLQTAHYRFDFGEYRAELWGLTAPATGVLTISAALTGANSTGWGMGAVTYTKQRTTATPFGGVNVGTATVTAAASLIVSATVGGVVVFGFNYDDPGTGSVGPGLILRARVGAGGSSPILIAEAPGATNVTGSASSALSTWANFGIHIIASAGGTNGSATMTDAPDVLSAPGYVIVSGRLSATEATDRFSASGDVIVQGRLSATDVVDTLSAIGKVRISGRLSATDVVGALSASGYVLVSGRLSATDAADLFSASGNMGAVTARLSATDAADQLSASGYTLVYGRLSATDTPDKLSASGYTLVYGRLSATDAPDIFSASGYVVPQAGSIVIFEPPDTLSAAGYVLVQGSINFTDAADAFSAPGTSYAVLVQGSIAFTDAPDIFSASGTVLAVSVSATAAEAVIEPGAGHGKPQKEYFRADEAFWTAREKYLKSIHKQISAEPEVTIDIPPTAEIVNTIQGQSPTVSPVLLMQLREARSKVISAMPAATSMRQLKPLGKRLYEINARIAEQKRLQLIAEQRAEARRQRSVARQRTIRKAKRKVLMLALARTVGALSYLNTQI